MNEYMDDFISAIKQKGILTQFDRKFRLLYSPPLNMSKSDSSLSLYTNKYTPNLYGDSTNNIKWGFDFSPIKFNIESAEEKKLAGKIIVPLDKISSKLIAK
jgi:hypothetical protein